MTKKRTTSSKSSGKRPAAKRQTGRKPARKKTPSSARAGAAPSRRKRIISWVATLCVWGVILGLGVLGWLAIGLPGTDDLMQRASQATIRIVDRNDTEIARYGDRYGDMIPATSLPAWLPQAVVAVEDRRFYSHPGLDIIGIARAFVNNALAGRVVQGGSTLTQQLAKNLFLSRDRTYVRKAREVLLALWLEQQFSKDEILTLYLNRVYFGAGAWGIESAAQRYFGKSAMELNLAESAMMAGLLKAPSSLAPTRNLEGARKRSRVVLDVMLREGVITAAQANRAKANPAQPVLAVKTGSRRYFVDWVMDQVNATIGHNDRNLTVVTTLDSRRQAKAEAALKKGLAGKKGVEGAVLAMNAKGAVRVMVGGKSYGGSAFNRAVQARRQPGSTFKLFVFLAALEEGWRPDQPLSDDKITIDGWTPRNYAGKYNGMVTMEDALSRSLNAAAVRLSETIGRDAVIDMARRLGVAGALQNHPGLALGASEVPLIDMTAAYTHIANGGTAVQPWGIGVIYDGRGNIVWQHAGYGDTPVLEERVVDEMDAMLHQAVRQGTGKKAAIKDRRIAGKTGTSQNQRDAWFIGYQNPGPNSLTMGVWLGRDDAKAMGKGMTGGGEAARIWADILSRM